MSLDFMKDVEKCIEVLAAGGVILYPTDTVWGLGCDATNEAAVDKIMAIKERPANKSFVVLVSSEKQVMQHAASVDLAVFDYLQSVNHPTTVIYEHALGIAENAVASDGSVAMRICNEEFCKHMIKRFRKPIISTSANISGAPAAATFPEISDVIKARVDYIVEYRRDDVSTKLPSSIIKWENGNIIKLR